MESLAYLHLALSYETEAVEVPSESPSRSTRRNWLGILSCWSASLVGMTAAVTLAAPQAVRATLRPGDRSAQVRDAQLRLQNLGYFNARATGYYGSITKASVLRFQRSRGLDPDGILGTQTQAALLESQSQSIAQNANAATYLGEGSQGNAVRSLQQRLRALGFYRGEITGSFDAATQEAVVQFQQAQGLKPDGVVGPRTFAALGSANPSASNAREEQTLARGDRGNRVRSLQQ
ncbi:MAG: peptidoglycan-binding protein, partial [Cyanobacteriota bacterium]|nr:peptidoglycan-binding protein [Cyanobacteriota bacterium]